MPPARGHMGCWWYGCVTRMDLGPVTTEPFHASCQVPGGIQTLREENVWPPLALTLQAVVLVHCQPQPCTSAELGAASTRSHGLLLVDVS
eukprot:COSAG04_NODE_29200_length_270_cov_0.970760_1_plen_89_part_11